MGFEIIYTYHERLDTGGYNTEEKKEMKRKVGEPYEDVSLEKLASMMMAQMARRDVWITDAVVYEYTKKQITFRETKGGLIIKNKKFLLDNESNIVAEEIPVEIRAAPAVSPIQIVPCATHPHEQLAPANQPLGRPLKFVTFAPNPLQMQEVQKKGLRFTDDRKYPVFREFPDPRDKIGGSMAYTTVDDLQRQVDISELYFVPAQVGLLGDRELGFSRPVVPQEGGKLRWEGVVDDKIPDVRRTLR